MLIAPATETISTAEPVPQALSEQRVLRLLLVAVSVALIWILLPFYGSVLWGAIIALLFTPLYRWLLPRLRGRRSLATLLTIPVATLLFVPPAVLVPDALAREARQVFELVESGELQLAQRVRGLFDALPEWITSLLGRFGLSNFDTVQFELAEALTKGSQFIATQSFSVGQNAVRLLVSVFIALYLAFFLVRVGDALGRAVHRAFPLAPSDRHALLEEFGTVLRATVKGNLVIAVVQGTLGGLAFLGPGRARRAAVGGADGCAVAAAGGRCQPGVAAGGGWLIWSWSPVKAEYDRRLADDRARQSWPALLARCRRPSGHRGERSREFACSVRCRTDRTKMVA